MSVPTYNLYDFVHQVTKNQFLLLYFYPWGSKNLKNICQHLYDDNLLNSKKGIDLKNRLDLTLVGYGGPDQVTQLQPILLCHDQEPLNFDLYLDTNPDIQNFINEVKKTSTFVGPTLQNLNLRWQNVHSYQRVWTLLHSELNSDELKKYENTGLFKGAYWWSHALIARDWYRYAEYDNSLHADDAYSKLFLVYCRDTTGSRKYRQQLLNQLGNQLLLDSCQTTSFHNRSVGPDASAIYESDDFNKTAISVVLETIFEKRIHLTEKTLRPIACGHPFILAAGPGSLSKLRSYGFKTFSPYIDESYDEIQDDQERLTSIVDSMKKFQNLSKNQQYKALKACQKISKYNKSLFFSKKFFNSIVGELQKNIEFSYSTHRGEINLELWWQDHRWRKNNLPDSCQDPKYKKFRSYLLPLYRRQRMTPSQSSSGSDSL